MKFKIFTLLFCVFSISCENSFQNQFIDVENKLVAHSYLNPDSVWLVHLSHTLGLLDATDIQVVENARVIISEEGGNSDKLLYFNDGLYIHPYRKPSVNKSYSLSIEKEGYNTIQAQTKIPQIVVIDSVTVHTEYIFNPPHTQNRNDLKIYFKDKSSELNYYQIRIVNSSDSYTNFSSSDPVIISEAPANLINSQGLYVSGGAIFSDILFNGKSYSLDLSTVEWAISDSTVIADSSFRIVLTSVSEDLYNYNKSWEKRKAWLEENNPYAEPVLIYNNIENGIGIFAGYSQSVCERRNWIVQ